MIRKNIQHIATVGLKYFFDLDYTLFAHTFTILFVALGFIKLASYWLKDEFQGGIMTVKSDMLTLKEQVAQISNRLETDNENAIICYFRNLKNNLQSHKNLSA